MNNFEEKFKKEKARFYTKVLEILPRTPSKMKQKELALKLGVSPRQFRCIVQKMREDAFPICSNSKDGYWYARNIKDIKDMLNYYGSYYSSIRKTMTGLKVALQNYIADKAEMEQLDRDSQGRLF